MGLIYHVHDVLQLLATTERPISASSFSEILEGTFGTSAVFTNCADEELSGEQVLEFLLARQKVRVDSDRVYLSGPGCSH
jgi:probable metal-binding protein